MFGPWSEYVWPMVRFRPICPWALIASFDRENYAVYRHRHRHRHRHRVWIFLFIFSHANSANGFVYLSGQIGDIDVGVGMQTTGAMENIEKILKGAKQFMSQ